MERSHAPQDVIELPFDRIAFGLAIDQLFEYFLGASELFCGNQSVAKLRKRIRHAEGIAGASVRIDQPFKWFEPAGHFGGKLIQETRYGIVLSGIQHGNA